MARINPYLEDDAPDDYGDFPDTPPVPGDQGGSDPWDPQPPIDPTPDNTSAPAPTPTPSPTPAPRPPSPRIDEEEHDALYGHRHHGTQTYGPGWDPSKVPGGIPLDWAREFISRNPGDYDPHRMRTAYASDAGGASGPSGSGGGPGGGGPGGGGRPSENVPPQFSDPIASWIERFAQQRAQDLENPPGGSGQALLEDILKDISGQFRRGGYTDAEMEIFQTQALDPLERLRQSRRQQVLQQLSARGITPNSGVALSMLADVDRQFDALRAQHQRDVAGRGAQEARDRMMQAVQLLGGLADTQNQRLDRAFQYRREPLHLADRAFNQAFQMYNAAGNPLAMVNPLLQLQQLQQNRGDNTQEMLGYLAYLFANMGNK